MWKSFSSPFLGTFFQSEGIRKPCTISSGFRPLSWGLFFNSALSTAIVLQYTGSFRPLSWGLFFNFCASFAVLDNLYKGFRPLSWGLFFNQETRWRNAHYIDKFSSPFLGTFFQLIRKESIGNYEEGFRPLSWGLFFNFRPFPLTFFFIVTGFRPLSWGLFFNKNVQGDTYSQVEVFVPFLGDFFSIRGKSYQRFQIARFSSPFLGTFFQ